MKKRKRRTPTLIDRFCKKFGPLIMKFCHFIDKHTHVFFEGLACILTGGAYRPRPYKETTDLNNKQYKGYHPHQSVAHNLMQDFKNITGDFHAVQKDMKKAVKKWNKILKWLKPCVKPKTRLNFKNKKNNCLKEWLKFKNAVTISAE